VEVSFTYPALGFAVKLVKTRAVIDGVEHRQGWGSSTFPLTPGRHEMEISFRWIFVPRAGRNTVSFDLAPGQVRRFAYRAPFFVFQKGPIRELTEGS